MYFKRNKKNIIIYNLLIIFTLITLIPLYIYPVIRGDDLLFHLLRIDDIKNGILYGHFPVNIMPNSLFGYGYGNGIFYPDLFLYFPALLRILGINLKLSYAIFMSLCTLISTFSMYFCSKKISHNKNIALYSSILYIFAQYKINDLYMRSAVGEYLCFMFIPIVLLGTYELVYKNYNKWYILTIGMSGIILSHLLSVFLIVIMCILIYLINIKRLIKEPKRIYYSIIAAIITILLTSYTWIPIIEQLWNGKFLLDLQNPFPYNRAISLDQIFFANGDNRFFTGIFLVILSFMYIFIPTKNIKNKFISTCFLIGIISLFLTIKTPILKYICNKLLLYDKIQFAWRMGIIATPLLCLISGYSIEKIIHIKRKLIIIIPLIIMSLINLEFYSKYYRIRNININNNYSNKYSTQIGCGKEYLPQGASINNLKQRGSIIKSNDPNFKYDNYIKKGPYITLDYEVSKENSYIELPLLYYKGYTFKIVSKNGEKKESGQATYNKNMILKVNTGSIKNGKLTVDYTGTKLMKLGYVISIITLVCMILFLFKNRKTHYIDK